MSRRTFVIRRRLWIYFFVSTAPAVQRQDALFGHPSDAEIAGLVIFVRDAWGQSRGQAADHHAKVVAAQCKRGITPSEMRAYRANMN
jgi:hypothetical protein